MRNGNFTIYNGYELQLSVSINEEYKLIYRGNECPFKGFIKYSENVYVLPIKESEVTNSYLVETFAIYKNFKFQFDKYENGKFRISTSDNEAYEKLNLHFVDRGWYDIWVSPEEIERMWEERKPSGLSFPYPHDLVEKQEISI